MELDIRGMEESVKRLWDDLNLYSFKYDGGSREQYFTIDTPPPTISGKMHMGHAFSYPHQDFIARYKRMRGYRVFYPWGFDDNGLPTERYAEKELGVKAENMELGEFIRACQDVARKAESELLRTWKDIGISADFSDFYTTSSNYSKRISQRMFIDLYRKGRAYRTAAPSIRCPTCKTAISQIEMKDQEMSTDFVYIEFGVVGGGSITIATTRPEMLGACIAVLVNPEDERYRALQGKEVTVPIYGQRVRIIPHPYVDPAKGTGAEMLCTFGDQNDLQIWRELRMDARIIIDDSGKMNSMAGPLAGMSIQDARKRAIEILSSSGLVEKVERIKHSVNTHERCNTPIEITISTQWFVRYLDLRDEFLRRGSEVNWIPEHMRSRYENWINGLRWDWCISRQRYFGVPFPVWYCRSCGEVKLADPSELPVDPRVQPPKGRCEKCGSDQFEPERDVMDTWATSSLTPRIALTRYGAFESLYPMDIRFQGHDIISFWAFTTIARSHIHDGKIPWKNLFISGNVYDPYGQKMSKSKGNIVEPSSVIEKYGADALRYWASTTQPGEDIKIREQDFVRGRRTVIKIYNASRLVHMLSDGAGQHWDGVPRLPESRWILSKIQGLIVEATGEMDQYQVSKARASVDNFFWNTFCDNYLEMAKARASRCRETGDTQGASETAAVASLSLLTLLKMYAPFLPFITESVYQEFRLGGEKSIHLERWPSEDSQYRDAEYERMGDRAVDIMAAVRALRSKNNQPLSVPIPRLRVRADPETVSRFGEIIRLTMKIGEMVTEEGQDVAVEVIA